MSPFLLLLAACNGATTDSGSVAPGTYDDRLPGERAPYTRTCDDQDPARCMLPWPSSAWLEADAGTSTGLRISIQPDSFPVDDDARWMNQADGFSRLTPVATVLDGVVADSGLAPWPAWSDDSALRIYVAEPDRADYGRSVPLWTQVTTNESLSPDSLIAGFPREPLAAGAEHVVVLTDGITVDGDAPVADRETRVILGLDEPATDHEARLAAYHAPTRTLLADVGQDPAHVLRVWDFTTRSAEDPTRRLASMIEQVAAATDGFGVEFDGVGSSGNETIDLIVLGRITGVPDFRDADGRLVLDADGLPVQQGTTDAEFRVMVPAGDGDYRVTLYGHGTGGDVGDDSFDKEFASFGIGKAGTRFLGWTGAELVTLFTSLNAFQSGIEGSTTGLMQAVANTQAILLALDGGVLSDALSADTVGGEPNPAAGRRPDLSVPFWMGGSLGGAMGCLISSAFPQVDYAICNVPNGAWSHTIPGSLLYETALKGPLANVYGDEIDVVHQLLISQTSWDDIDAAAWAEPAIDKGTMFLLQESMDDPVVPNPGTDILAVALGAKHIGPPLEVVPGLEAADQVTSGAAFTQYRVPNTGVYDVHGFAARETEAGAAAFEQMVEFVQSVWDDGSPLITFPDACADVTPNGDCDFTEVMVEDE
ncbi:MAG: hypothetical protein H6742_19730 [Alphaproteobacteria bacterium]|nr:hypothetical protein [Alphaproteobacteria bacterium]